MLPLNDITQLAIKVQSATAERENTAVRVGTAIAELCKYVNQLPTVAGFSFVPSATGVDLVIKTLTEAGQEATTALAIPLLSAGQAGVFTPQMLTALKADVRKDFANFDKQVRDLIQASEEVMSRQMEKLEGKARDNAVAISQLNSDIIRLDSFVRTSTNEEREAVEQLLGAIDKTENGQKVYYLSRFISDDALAMLRAKFPMLRIEQPEYTLIKYHDSVPNGTFASNLDNRTGYQFGKAYAPSGHVSKILEARERVILHKGSDGVKRYARLNQDNPALSLAGETIDYTGDKGWAMNLEPEYWYKGVNDIINKEHYAAFAFGKKPSNPRGKKLDGATLLASKTAGYAYSSVSNYDIVALDAHKVQDSGYMTINVDVSGYRYARFPFSQLTKGGYGHVFLDANGRKVGHAIVDAFEDTWDGCYLVYPIPDNATMMCLTYPSNFVLDFVWLTASDNPADWEPDWVHHPKRFVGFCNCKWDNPTNVSGQTFDRSKDVAYIGMKAGTSQYGINTKNIIDNYETMGRGFDFSSYEDYKDMMQLYYARYGQRNAINTLTTGQNIGVTDVFTLPVRAYTEFKSFTSPNVTHLPNGTEIKVRPSLFMGYALGSSFNFAPFLDTKLIIKGPVLGKKGAADGRVIPFPNDNGSKYHTLKTLCNGKYLDITPATGSTDIATTDYYAMKFWTNKKLFGEVLALISTTYNKEHIGNPSIGNGNVYLAVGQLLLCCDGEGVLEMSRYEDILV